MRCKLFKAILAYRKHKSCKKLASQLKHNRRGINIAHEEWEQWFKDNIPLLQDIWTIIEKERISGYEHRAPNRKQKKTLVENTTNTGSGCLLQFNKETGKINVIKKDIDNTVYIPILDIQFN